MKRLTMRTAVLNGMLMAALAVQAAPHMELSDQDFKFGYAPPNAKLSHRFVLRSTGDDTLRIIQVNPGCGCTKAPLQKETAAPGDSTSVEIIFSTGNYRGSISKSPFVTTNAATDPQPLRFTANVVTRPDSTYPLVIKPFGVDLSAPGAESGTQTTLTLTNVSEVALHPVLVDTPEDILTLKLPETIEPGKSAQAFILLNPKLEAPGFEKSVTIQLDDEAKTRFTIPVVRNVGNVVKTMPASAPK